MSGVISYNHLQLYYLELRFLSASQSLNFANQIRHINHSWALKLILDYLIQNIQWYHDVELDSMRSLGRSVRIGAALSITRPTLQPTLSSAAPSSSCHLHLPNSLLYLKSRLTFDCQLLSEQRCFLFRFLLLKNRWRFSSHSVLKRSASSVILEFQHITTNFSTTRHVQSP